MGLRYATQLNSRLMAEAVRYLEEHNHRLPSSDHVEQTIAHSGATVEARILERAALLGPDAGVPASVHRVQRLSRLLSYVFMGLFLLLGSLAALQAFTHNAATVNFYWLLLVLLGLNLASMAFWAFGLWAGSRQNSNKVPLAHSGAYLIKRWIEKTGGSDSVDALTAGAWLGVMLNGAVGRWNLSCLTHLLWSSYLCGGLLMIFLLFSARQYDFVWETTLLQEGAFIQLTQWLAILPAKLGVATPSLEQITQSRLGADPALLAEARQSWASLLIASILLYGLVPRLILLALCSLFRARALSGYRLLLSRPYYVRLRQRLMPTATPLGVVDRDEEAPSAATTNRPHGDHRPLPADAHWLGIELGPEESWPLPAVDKQHDLGCINDRDSQQQALRRIKALGNQALVIAVSLQRSPDRGLARIITQLLDAHRRNTWLVLLESSDSDLGGAAERDARLCDWYALADNSGMDADHITQRTLLAPVPGGRRAGND